MVKLNAFDDKELNTWIQCAPS